MSLHLNFTFCGPPKIGTFYFTHSDNFYLLIERVFFFFFFFDRVSLCLQDGVRWHDLCSLQLCLLGSSNSPASAFQVVGATGACYHTQLIFIFLVEMGFHHVGQCGLHLLISWSTHFSLPKCWDYRLEPLSSTEQTC